MLGIKLPAHLSKAASNMAIKSSAPKACKAFRSRDLPAAKALEVDWCEVLHQAALACLEKVLEPCLLLLTYMETLEFLEFATRGRFSGSRLLSVLVLLIYEEQKSAAFKLCIWWV